MTTVTPSRPTARAGRAGFAHLALAAGWPIATGVIEGACRHVPVTGSASPEPAGGSKAPEPSSCCAP